MLFKKILFFFIVFLSACSTGNIVIENVIVSGGDHGLKASLDGNIAHNINYTDTVAFYKNLQDSKFQTIESNAIRVYLMKQEKSGQESIPKTMARSVLVIQKYIIEHSFWTGKQPATNISFEKKEIDLKPFNYNMRFWYGARGHT